MKAALLAATLLIASAPSAWAERENCLKYEPFEVSLTGTVYSKIYPGPPNYESIKRGDVALRHYFFIPDAPFCTVAEPNDELNGNADDVKVVQFDLIKVRTGNLRSYMKKFKGEKVRVTGTLSSRIFAYHRTPDLLDVTSIVVVKSK